VIEGANLLEEALRAEIPLEAVYVGSDEAERPGRLEALLARCYEQGARVFELEPGVLARVAGTVTPQPVMAVVHTPSVTMADIQAQDPSLVVVCVDVRDPGNAGTVARSAWAAGADAVVCCEGTVDLWNPKAVRSSAGAVLHVPVIAAGAAVEVLDELGTWGLARWGTASRGGEDYAAADLTKPCALVLGNEAGGLRLDVLSDKLDGLISIPMAAGAESLNVGMAAAVLCFEAVRQRRHLPTRTPAPASAGPPGERD
jgi:TrmH family RNA methyltransferase